MLKMYYAVISIFGIGLVGTLEYHLLSNGIDNAVYCQTLLDFLSL